MKRITAFKITDICMSGFRNHLEKQHFRFGDMSFISGHNGSGKTTMAHAVCYALFGVSYYGESKIERLINENSDTVCVELSFMDDDGERHKLTRCRRHDKTQLMLDGYSIQQRAVEQMFCDKDTFLSLFNPSYLIENMGDKGRELILKYLKPVSVGKVLEQLPQYETVLKDLSLDSSSPEEMIKSYRCAVRSTEQQIGVLEGQASAFEDARNESLQKLDKLKADYDKTIRLKDELIARQYDGIDLQDLSNERERLMCGLESGGQDGKVQKLKSETEKAKQRVYVSKYTQALADAKAEVNQLSQKYMSLSKRLSELKVGDKCSTCFMSVTEDNIESVKAAMTAECKEIIRLGKGAAANVKELEELDKKSKDAFEQFKADDIKKLTDELNAASYDNGQSGIKERLQSIDALKKYGNLTEQEYLDLTCLEADAVGLEAQIAALKNTTDEQKLKDAQLQKEVLTEQLNSYKGIITALGEFIFKRTELATESINMPGVTLRLYDIVRTTGEVVNAFKFYYKGRDYRTLLLSEKTLAGIEVAAMLRRITGLDYPICIDNTESIAALNSANLPSQTLMIRFIKDKPLNVQYKDVVTSASDAALLRAS